MLNNKNSRFNSALRLQGTALASVWTTILVLTLWGAVVVLLEELGLLPGKISPVPFTFIGLPIGFFLAFRGNQGYARYWEARQHWATVGNFARNIGRQVNIYLRGPAEDEAAISALRRDVIESMIAYVYALRSDLMSDDPFPSAQAALGATATPERHPEQPSLALSATRNVPYAILCSLLRQLDFGFRRNWLDRIFLRHMDAQLSLLSDAAGVCLKIRDTPMPVPLVVLTKRMLLIYLFFLPIGIVDMTGWFAPVVVSVISFAFLGLDAIAAELGHPFETGPNQIALLTTAHEIETDLRALLGDTTEPLPPPIDDVVP
ncbi:MAG: hypothetical protein KC609_13020 [Myxococcales bacterium]|nr:hypothetical protein [Myxococcales bacterium]